MIKTAVVIADDHEIVRQGLKGLIDAQADLAVVGEADTGLGALECVGRLSRVILVLDLDMPDISGIEVLQSVVRDHPSVRVVVFSSFAPDLFAAAVVEAGAVAYVCKNAGSDLILDALRLAVGGLNDPPSRSLH